MSTVNVPVGALQCQPLLNSEAEPLIIIDTNYNLNYTVLMLTFASLFTAISLGLSLAADAFVACLALAVTQQLRAAQRLTMALTFGIFQGVMPIIGWLGGYWLLAWVMGIQSWISFLLLVFVGGNMIKAALYPQADAATTQLTLRTVLSLAIATSIDALAVGFTLPSVTTHPVFTCVMIAVITMVCCSLALFAGRLIPKRIGKPAELFAGSFLILLGISQLL